jgi:hypothetical protein
MAFSFEVVDGPVEEGGEHDVNNNKLRAPIKMAGDCPNFAESSQQNGTVPLSEAILLDALSSTFALFLG